MLYTCRKQPPTREELLVQIGDIEVKIKILESIKNSSGPKEVNEKRTAALENSLDELEKQVDQESKDIVTKKFNCVSNSLQVFGDKKKNASKDGAGPCADFL